MRYQTASKIEIQLEQIVANQSLYINVGSGVGTLHKKQKITFIQTLISCKIYHKRKFKLFITLQGNSHRVSTQSNKFSVFSLFFIN